jgi:hypothetical protein
MNQIGGQGLGIVGTKATIASDLMNQDYLNKIVKRTQGGGQ